jgi:hypothetical protein
MVFPYAAPSIGAFIGNSPLGVRQGCRTLSKGQESLLTTPGKCEKRRKQAASGGFLLDTFLCPRKEKYLVRGYENPYSNNRRVSDTLKIPLTLTLSHKGRGDIIGFPASGVSN